VDEEKMQVVQRIFELVGRERTALRSVQQTLEREGVPTPATTKENGGRRWSTSSIRDIVLDDVYKPHTFEEIMALVTPEVAGKLDPKERYGILWWGRRKVTTKQVAEERPGGGRRYRKKQEVELRSRERQVPIPVPDGRVSRELVEAARDAIKDNRPTQRENNRFWELSGVFICGACGRKMATSNRRSRPRDSRIYHYYRCSKHQREGAHSCPMSVNYRAERIEAEVWEYVAELMVRPEEIIAELDRLIEEERSSLRTDP